MKRFIAFLIVAMLAPVAKADVNRTFVYDKVVCVKMAEIYQQNMFKMSLNELETFRQCVSYDLPKAMSKQYMQKNFRPLPPKLQDAE